MVVLEQLWALQAAVWAVSFWFDSASFLVLGPGFGGCAGLGVCPHLH